MQDKPFIDTTYDRAVAIGRYVAESGATVRQAAAVFGISKSTRHKDLTIRLRHENPYIYSLVCKVLEKNKNERHIRGGQATKEKYLIIKSNKI